MQALREAAARTMQIRRFMISLQIRLPLINAAARTQLQGNRLRMLQNGLSIFANVIQTDIKM